MKYIITVTKFYGGYIVEIVDYHTAAVGFSRIAISKEKLDSIMLDAISWISYRVEGN